MSAKRWSTVVVVLLALLAAVPAQASPPQPVMLDLHAHLTGPSTIAGDWRATGAFSDAGTYTESFGLAAQPPIQPRTVRTEKVLVGANGTLRLRAVAVIVWLSPTRLTFKAGNWRITSGTGAYRQLHAGGTPAVTADSFADLATGVVDMKHVGRAH